MIKTHNNFERTFIFKNKYKDIFYSIPVSYDKDVIHAYLILCFQEKIATDDNDIIFVKEI